MKAATDGRNPARETDVLIRSHARRHRDQARLTGTEVTKEWLSTAYLRAIETAFTGQVVNPDRVRDLLSLLAPVLKQQEAADVVDKILPAIAAMKFLNVEHANLNAYDNYPMPVEHYADALVALLAPHLNDQGCAEAVRKIMDLCWRKRPRTATAIQFQTSRHVSSHRDDHLMRVVSEHEELSATCAYWRNVSSTNILPRPKLETRRRMMVTFRSLPRSAASAGRLSATSSLGLRPPTAHRPDRFSTRR